MPTVNDPLSAAAIFRAVPRVWDDLPLWAQINITNKCNLDCSYCTEYNNSLGHVPYDDLIRRVDHCKHLGCLHVDFIGGEPLLHPNLTQLMRDVTSRSMTTGMTTNAFLLTSERLQELIDAGLGRLQISVDSVNPRPGIPKSLKTLRGKIEMASKARIRFRVLSVMCEETIDEVEEVARFCADLGVGVFFSVVHDRGRLVRKDSARMLERLDWLKSQKRAGKPVDTPYYMFDYYEAALKGRPVDWTCQAGSKCFYVSPEGKFHFCYHVPPVRDFLELGRADLAGFRGKKGCEENCGVDCVIQTSLPYSNRGRVLLAEVRERLPIGRGAARATGHGAPDPSPAETP